MVTLPTGIRAFVIIFFNVQHATVRLLHCRRAYGHLRFRCPCDDGYTWLYIFAYVVISSQVVILSKVQHATVMTVTLPTGIRAFATSAILVTTGTRSA